MNLSRALVGTVGARLVGYMLATVSGILIARFLGPMDRGTYAVLTNIIIVLHAVGLLGIETGNLYYTVQKSDIRSLIANSLAIGLGSGILITACFLVFFNFTQGRLFPGVSLIPAVIAISSVTPAILFSYLSGILWGQSRIFPMNILGVTVASLQLAALGFLWLFFKVGFLELLVISFSLSVFSTAVCLFLLEQTPMTRSTFTMNWDLMRKMIRYSRAAYGANAFYMIAARVDVLLLNIFVGGPAVGHYAVAATMAQLMLVVPQSAQRVLFVRFSGTNVQDASDLVSLASRTIIALMSGFVLITAFFAVPAVRFLLGNEYASSATILLLLLPGVVALSILGVTASYINGMGRPDVTMRVSLGILVTIVCLDVVLIPYLGANGAAIAASTAYIFAAGVELSVVLRWSETRLGDALLLKWQDLRYYRSSGLP